MERGLPDIRVATIETLTAETSCTLDSTVDGWTPTIPVRMAHPVV
ncbi:hypothetical protein [Natrarchaeobius chitinivorans]|nr:hypothetical protein [Natrarchaeobius chitinivorans]